MESVNADSFFFCAGGYVDENGECQNKNWQGNYWHRTLVSGMQTRKAFRMYFWMGSVIAGQDSPTEIGRSVSRVKK